MTRRFLVVAATLVILRYKLPNDFHWHETAPLQPSEVLAKWAELEADGAWSIKQIAVKGK